MPDPAASAPPVSAPAPCKHCRVKRALLALLLVAGAATAAWWLAVDRTALPASPRAPVPVPAALDAALRCDPAEPLSVEVAPAVDVEGRPVLAGKMRVRRSGQASAHEVGVWFYRAEGVPEGAKAPALVVSPILGGDHDIERIIARDLTAHGMHALIVDRRLPSEPRIEGFQEALTDMVAARRRAIDWLETRPEVDAARIGAYGVSLGGMNTTILAAVEPRLKASVIVMAGGDFASVLAGSVEGEAVELRKAYGAGPGPLPETPEEEAARAAFVREAQAKITTCPLALAKHVDPRKTILFTTRRDTSVPSPCQERLRLALGEPETWSFPTGHYSAIVYLPLITREARRFLAERFEVHGGVAAIAPRSM
jgi:dienelactone hydrolase